VELEVAEPPIVEGETVWMVEQHGGKMKRVRVLGTNGRISYGRNQRADSGEVRIYRTQGAKHYDAVIPDVKAIWSHNVIVEDIGKTAEVKELEAAYEAEQKDRFDRVISSVLERHKKGVLPPDEEDLLSAGSGYPLRPMTTREF
jgi:hypothetical protein